MILLFFLVVSTVQASTTLYLRNTAAADPRPATKQSSDTILHDAATSRATYANPANMLITPGTASQTNQGTFGGTVLNHRTHYGSFIGPPLYPQTITGTITVGLVMRESNAASHNFPRIYLYVWKSDNTGRRCDLVPLTTSAMEVSTAYPGSPTVYFTAVALTDCTISLNDRIVLEIETDDNPTLSTAYSHGLRFGGAAGGGYGSYLTFSNDLHMVITPAFTANKTSGACDLPVQFTDTSSYTPDQWFWDFGDGETSTLQNPVHVFQQAGTFNVSLQACNPGGCSWKNSTSFIRTTMNTSFFGTPTTGSADLPVTFTDTSLGTPTRWTWRFGDGSTSTLQNPDHTYARAGTFQVELQACRGSVCTWSRKPAYISVAMNSTFTSNVTTGPYPLTVRFSDTSSGSPTSWLWLFGDGGSSTSRNVTHIYSQPGQYEVDFRACRGTFCAWNNRTAYITATMTAMFSANQTVGSGELAVQFTDQTPGLPTSWYWDFGDGSISTSRNPTHTYLQAGTFDVNFQACRGSFCSWSNRTSFITVTMNTSFTADQTTGDADFPVQFTDLSRGSPDSWLWIFGDGSSSLEQHPLHTYTMAGVYGVGLYACRGNSCSWENVTALITVNMTADFTADQVAGDAGFPFQFTDLSRGSPDSWLWIFGDGATSTDQHPVHAYTTAGTYDVHLEACRGLSCNWSNRTGYITVAMSASFIANHTEGRVGVPLQFSDTSLGGSDSWLWRFGDGETSTDQHPVHRYAQAGLFGVDFQACHGSICDWENRTDYISISPDTAFSSNATAGDADLAVQFTDLTGGDPDSWLWYFGDGSSSQEQNPVQIYSQAGEFEVEFRACRGTFCAWENRTACIQVGMNASFTADPTSGDTPLSVQFTDTSRGSPDAWYWEFGDGATGTLQNPSHVYVGTGQYQVKLHSCRNYSCDWENKTQYVTASKPPSSPKPHIRISSGSSGPAGSSISNVQHLKEGGPYTYSFDDTTPVSRITLTLREPVDDFLITVEEMDAVPSMVPRPPGTIFGYFTVEYTENGALNVALIDFSVQRGWLEGNKFSPGDVNLLIYRNYRWETLPTVYLSESEEEIQYQARSSGLLHYFAIAGASEGAAGTEPSAEHTTEGMVVWVGENPLPVSLVVGGLVLLAYLGVRRYLLNRDQASPDGRPEGWETMEGLFEGDRERAYSAIIDILNRIDAQLTDLDVTFALKGPGYVFPQRDAKAVVDRFFFSCQVAERRIKAAAADNHITQEQIAYLNDQLRHTVDQMIATSKQSDILSQLVQDSLGAQAGA
jgi:PGF-pre-PGF domain-containing protein